MITNFIKSIFYKEKWPKDKDIRLILSMKGQKKDTVIYLNNHQFNSIMGMIDIGNQVLNMVMVIPKMGLETMQEFIQ